MNDAGSADRHEESPDALAVVSGPVIHGRGLGHTVGLPTANIGFPAEELGIEYGVYATMIEVDGKRYRSITNIGTKPTVENNGQAGIETNIFDFDQDIYGRIVRLEVFKFIRGIMKFSSLQEVKRQTETDRADAIAFFNSHECFL